MKKILGCSVLCMAVSACVLKDAASTPSYSARSMAKVLEAQAQAPHKHAGKNMRLSDRLRRRPYSYQGKASGESQPVRMKVEEVEVPMIIDGEPLKARIVETENFLEAKPKAPRFKRLDRREKMPFQEALRRRAERFDKQKEGRLAGSLDELEAVEGKLEKVEGELAWSHKLLDAIAVSKASSRSSSRSSSGYGSDSGGSASGKSSTSVSPVSL